MWHRIINSKHARSHLLQYLPFSATYKSSVVIYFTPNFCTYICCVHSTPFDFISQRLRSLHIKAPSLFISQYTFACIYIVHSQRHLTLFFIDFDPFSLIQLHKEPHTRKCKKKPQKNLQIICDKLSFLNTVYGSKHHIWSSSKLHVRPSHIEYK